MKIVCLIKLLILKIEISLNVVFGKRGKGGKIREKKGSANGEKKSSHFAILPN